MTPESAFWHASTNTPIPEQDALSYCVWFGRHPGDYALVRETATGALYRAEPELPLPVGFTTVEASIAHLPKFWSLERMRFYLARSHRPPFNVSSDKAW